MIQVEIVIKGYLDGSWSDWSSSSEIDRVTGYSKLEGPVRDQVELRGILSYLADLGLDLISVNTKTRGNAIFQSSIKCEINT